MLSYGEIQSEVILNGGTLEDVNVIYEKQQKGEHYTFERIRKELTKEKEI